MLKLASGSFGLRCELCSKQGLKAVAARKTTLPTTLNRHGGRGLTTLQRSSKYLPTSTKENAEVLRKLVKPQKNIRTFCVSVPYIKHSLQDSMRTRNILMNHPNVRNIGTVPKLLGRFGRFLRIRYLVLTGAVAGGVAANQTIDSWKKYIPDLEWMKAYFPDETTRDKLFKPVRDMKTIFGNFSVPEKGWFDGKVGQITGMKEWLEQLSLDEIFGEEVEMSSNAALPKLGIYSAKDATSTADVKKSQTQSESRNRQDELNEEIMKIQTKYQKELDRLEKENRDLRKQISLLDQKPGHKRKMNTSLIDMYSEILDVLAEFDSSYNTQDHLPRVVVVGDQSAGKTSVLEMIARARIFPRGSGEMMTRSPVKVTLSEGPYHVAQFKDSSREFDLTNPAETEALRREVEVRMKKSVSKGQTVSNECISMSVKGPGIQRMVLVDLPGIISTETTIMAPDTKDNIKKLVRSYMENPNAIILCIQDGSLDAERSNVTDVVSQIDPSGKRTIFVLTKVDLAESNLYNPNRIKSILEGKLFPMKALGYFAVVTGKGNTNDSIESIREYEDQFFRKSRLLKDGALKHTQMNTQNLSLAVSELFWKMVKENIEQQTDAFKATRFNLETEWKNNFPHLRELDRVELFEKAKGEVLDEVINLSLVTAKQWESLFHKKLWDKTATHVFENIFVPAAQSESIGEFNTVIDIKLTDWANHALPKKSVEVGWDVLHEEFLRLIRKEGKSKKTGIHDELFNKLKYAVIDASKSTHNWDGKAEDSLRVIQRNTLEDRSVHDRQQWDAAISFMEGTLKEQLKRNEDTLNQLTGPGTWEQWRHWRHKTQEHKNRINTVQELERILKPQHRHKPFLSQDELTTVRQTLQSQGTEVDTEFIKQTWYHVFRDKFIKKALQQCTDCKKGFYLYQNNIKNSGLDCHEVVLFWRLQRMLEVTSNALRQQVINNEARRLERIIKDVLDDFSEDRERLKKLLTGRPVELAEEIRKVRQIQEKLEEFIEALNREK